MNVKTIRHIGLERVDFAYNAVKSINEDDSISSEDKIKYKTSAKKLPVMIRTNGIGQTLAYLKDRNDGYNALYEQLGDWFIKNELIFKAGSENEDDIKKNTLEKVVNLTSLEYRRLTLEAITISSWFSRFVDSIMKTVEVENG